MMKKLAGMVIAAAFVVGLSGCSAFDGEVDSSITGKESTPEEIRSVMIQKGSEFQTERIDLRAKAEKLNAREAALLEIGNAEIAEGLAERETLTNALEGGIDMVGTVTKMVFPQSAALVDLVSPLVRQGIALAGIGGLVGVGGVKFGTKRGASKVTEGIAKAAEEDQAFRDAIMNGDAGTALSRHFRKAPKAVRKAIDENKVM